MIFSRISLEILPKLKIEYDTFDGFEFVIFIIVYDV